MEQMKVHPSVHYTARQNEIPVYFLYVLVQWSKYLFDLEEVRVILYYLKISHKFCE